MTTFKGNKRYNNNKGTTMATFSAKGWCKWLIHSLPGASAQTLNFLLAGRSNMESAAVDTYALPTTLVLGRFRHSYHASSQHLCLLPCSSCRHIDPYSPLSAYTTGPKHLDPWPLTPNPHMPPPSSRYLVPAALTPASHSMWGGTGRATTGFKMVRLGAWGAGPGQTSLFTG